MSTANEMQRTLKTSLERESRRSSHISLDVRTGVATEQGQHCHGLPEEKQPWSAIFTEGLIRVMFVLPPNHLRRLFWCAQHGCNL
ncbi:hypothetical protein A3Q35_02185 [Aeribacillus pallidus]|uniref:Uncharacterized protein n=1 Tax=Aeribacillus pallidus TaxID=33936 RepID=A0A163Z325_9BACI|nr:hypothetical protein AP3564_13035 [Aeribacillus pallidus]KZM54444.1 hypothetical protein A3Q35_02185 [Aeribacillus pallidus]